MVVYAIGFAGMKLEYRTRVYFTNLSASYAIVAEFASIFRCSHSLEPATIQALLYRHP